MDDQAFFTKEKSAFLQRWSNANFNPKPCPYIVFDHFEDPSIIKVLLGEVDQSTAVEWAGQALDPGVVTKARVLLTHARPTSYNERGEYVDILNPDGELPFGPETFRNFVEFTKLHEASFASCDHHLQVIKSERGDGKTSMYIENFAHRECWIRLSVTFDAVQHVSTSFLRNLLPKEREFIKSKLENVALQSFSLHPLFVPVLVIELLFHEALQHLGAEFGNSIQVFIAAGLHAHQRYKHRKQEDLNPEQASEDSIRHEQNILILFEKIESAIKMGAKVLTWFGTFDTSLMSKLERERFQSADAILRSRMKYLLEGFELQLIRLRRTQGHAQLNRLGLQFRNSTLGNKLSASISEQSRDIARESRRDSSAMKAIAVLTMFFLPGTFVAAFFSMPLFNWTSSPVISSSFWIYWAITVPATFLILAIWRIWYRFDEWRQSEPERSTMYRDFLLWIRPGKKRQDKEMDLENGKTGMRVGLWNP